ncbi:MAG: hypothetical protein WCV86_01975 [Patescibacteria group bacterium]|jgi:hypothetical protein
MKKLCEDGEVVVEVRSEGGKGHGFLLLLSKRMGRGNSCNLAEHVAWIIDNMPRWKTKSYVVWTMRTSIGGILISGKRHVRRSPKGKVRVTHNVTSPGGGSKLGLTPKKPLISCVGRQDLIDPKLFIERRLRRLRGNR